MKRTLWGLCLLTMAIVLSACGNNAESRTASSAPVRAVKTTTIADKDLHNLYLAGGCFWGWRPICPAFREFRM